MMPGTATPGEMEQAMSMGLDVVKFFPAEQNGGVAKLKAVAGPYTNLRWMPTGGVNAKNLLDYLSFNKIIACGGTWMVKKDLIEAENWDEIERLTREAVNTMLGFEVKHIGINTENAEEAMKAAKLFELMFGFDVAEGNSSIFCGSRAIEIMKKAVSGKERPHRHRHQHAAPRHRLFQEPRLRVQRGGDRQPQGHLLQRRDRRFRRPPRAEVIFTALHSKAVKSGLSCGICGSMFL